MKRPSTLVASALWRTLLVTVTAAGCAATGSAPVEPVPLDGDTTARVVRVVDGDTVTLDIDVSGTTYRETVRLIGVDTPETVHPERPVECFGPEAAAYTASLLPPSTRVRIERDIEARDAYGRLLLYVHRQSDELFVNLALVDGGYAVPLPIEPNTTFAAEFAAAATRAERASQGLWGVCGG